MSAAITLSNLSDDIFGLTKSEIIEILSKLEEKSFRAKQIWRWIYCESVFDYAKMTDLSKATRQKLTEHLKFQLPDIDTSLTSCDGTVKFVLKFADNKKVETVYIPETKRVTICVSSQVGCALKCKFCHTGTQKLMRNLSAAEIVKQVILVHNFAQKKAQEAGEKIKPINIVFMGMGEPFYNYNNVAKAIKIIMDNEGLAISRRRITISTSGIIPIIKKCAEELRVNLAISLHAPSNEVRNKIMPINRRYPIEQLIETCRKYQKIANSRRITFEYVMLKSLNDSVNQARSLIQLIKGIPCIVNLLPFNKWPGSSYECSDKSAISDFAQIIKNSGYQATIRTPRGQDILAACGQLKSETTKKIFSEN
ncbi:MAG: 23S rRNA (adenine(2503)-C(2))-methyltransferase RlmN [Rickettsiales bacterium]|nr:23S rRNA (adenine(2503)-C(2))-methyltransferase RlmN [Rickettsiales bacterium]